MSVRLCLKCNPCLCQVFCLSVAGGAQSSETIILFCFLLSGYINSTYSKTGYWFSILSVLLGSSILSLVNMEEDEGVLHSLPPPPHTSNTKRPGVSYDPEISMNYGSKVDKYLGGAGDLNGNFKGRQVEVGVGAVNSRNLSYSDPALLTSSQPPQVSRPSHSHTCSSLWQPHQAGGHNTGNTM